jgi:hypothetical protein
MQTIALAFPLMFVPVLPAAAIVTSSLTNDPIVFPGKPTYGIDLGGVAVLGSSVPHSEQLDDIIFTCTGTLISDRHILTSAHCLDEDEDGRVDFLIEAFPFAAGFQLADRTDVLEIDSTQAAFAPSWPDVRGDLAVLTLAEPAPADIPRYPLYGKFDEVGQPVVIAGYGVTGYGGLGIGDVESPLYVNTLRAGLNRFEAVRDDLDNAYLAYDFDSGSPFNNALAIIGFDSDVGLGDEEAMTAPGDSGGPVLIDGAIAGVTSFGARLPSADINDVADYSWGELAFGIRVSAFREFLIQATDGAAVFAYDALPGDYNASGTIEQADLDLVLLHWGAGAMTPPTGWLNDPPTRLIDQDELDGVLLNWGNTASVRGTFAAVPEPPALSLALVVTCLAYSLFRSSAPLWLHRPAG